MGEGVGDVVDVDEERSEVERPRPERLALLRLRAHFAQAPAQRVVDEVLKLTSRARRSRSSCTATSSSRVSVVLMHQYIGILDALMSRWARGPATPQPPC